MKHETSVDHLKWFVFLFFFFFVGFFVFRCSFWLCFISNLRANILNRCHISSIEKCTKIFVKNICKRYILIYTVRQEIIKRKKNSVSFSAKETSRRNKQKVFDKLRDRLKIKR